MFVQTLVDRLVERFQPLAGDKQITFQALISPGIAVAGDETRLLQMLSNLLDNAIRYTNLGGSIQIQAHRAPAPRDSEPARIRLTIADTGVGIPPEQIEQIFQRFHRGIRSDNGSDGFGLGLPIVREIVGLHRGTIDVSSQVGVGTTWLIELPAAQP